MKVCMTVLLFAACAVFSSRISAEEKAPYFSNQDIEQYRKSPDAVSAEAGKTTRAERKASTKTSKEKQEQELWCRRANAQKKKITKAQYDLGKAEKDMAEAKEKSSLTSKKRMREQKRFDRAKQQLAAEEKELTDLENEAHRKSVPPGWLRCQFD